MIEVEAVRERHCRGLIVGRRTGDGVDPDVLDAIGTTRLEREHGAGDHADAVADRVVAGQSAEALLDTMAPGAGGGVAVQLLTDGIEPAPAVEASRTNEQIAKDAIDKNDVADAKHHQLRSSGYSGVNGGDRYKLIQILCNQGWAGRMRKLTAP